MATADTNIDKPVPINAQRKKFQRDLVQAVKVGDFKKSARLRESIANLK